MKKTLALLMLVSSLTAVRSQSTYYVFLDGPSESPANASPGTGVGTVVYDPTLHTLQLQVTFSGLTGITTASHIHAATANPFAGTAGVATTTPSFAGFPLGVSSGSFSNTLDLTVASSFNAAYVTANGGTLTSAEAALAAAMAGGRAYWNIHSSTFGGGEIRGFLSVVPEPSSTALAGVGVVGLALRAWHKRRVLKR